MEDKFQEITREYAEFQNSLLKSGRLPMKDTGVGFWGGAIPEEVYSAFKQIGLGRYRNFIDIGSGDGRVVLIASLFGVRAAGVEFDSELFKVARSIQQKLNIPGAIFYNNDYFDHSISGYDLVFLNPDKPLGKGIEKKLINEMTGKLILYGHHFHPQNLNRHSSFIVNGTKVSVYGKEK